jgi:primosomal protein N'
MFINKIIPISNIPKFLPQEYSYFTSQKLPLYSLVSINLGKSIVKGIVFQSEEIKSKISIKKASFTIKPIKKILNSSPVITRKQIELLNWISGYNFLSFSNLLKISLLSGILEKLNLINLIDKDNDRLDKLDSSDRLGRLDKLDTKYIDELNIKNNEKLKTEKKENILSKRNNNLYIFENNFDFLKKEIRENISKNKQIFLLFPNRIKLEEYREKLNEFDLIVFGEKKRKKEKIEEYQSINDGKIKVILGLRQSVFIPFNNLGLIVIVEEENSSYQPWKEKTHFDSKTIAIKLADIFNSQIIFISHSPSLKNWEVISKKKMKTIGKLKEIEKNKIEFLSKERSKDTFHPRTIKEIKILLEDNKKKNKKIFVFSNRKGISPALVCQDCGYIFRCPNCESSMSYYQLFNKPEIYCRHCGIKEIPKDKCPNCQGYFITPINYGTEKVKKELDMLFPNKKIKIFDSDNIKNIEEEKKIFEQFKENKIDIIIGTELFLKFLKEKIDLIVIISLEQITNFPDFQINEKLRQILKKMSLSGKKILIQKSKTNEINPNILKKNNEFYEQELKMRKKFLFPPFSEIIKINYKGKNKQETFKQANNDYLRLKKIIPDILGNNFKITSPLPAFVPKIINLYLFEIFLRIEINSIEINSNELLPNNEYILKRNKILEKISKQNIKINPINLL